MTRKHQKAIYQRSHSLLRAALWLVTILACAPQRTIEIHAASHTVPIQLDILDDGKHLKSLPLNFSLLLPHN